MSGNPSSGLQSERPSVLFVCSKNGRKSQLAAGLMNQLANGAVTVHYAGTAPGKALNPGSVDSLAEPGIEGMERMRLVRDDIKPRVQQLTGK